MSNDTWTARVSCPDCGDVTLNRDGLTLHQCDTGQGSYAFQCPECGRRTARTCSEPIFGLLIAAGFEPRYWSLPAEMFEERQGRPISFRERAQFFAWLDSL